MCGIGGIVNLKAGPIASLESKLNVISSLIAHRGPDGEGHWRNDQLGVGLVHRRLAILDLSETGHQPMVAPSGNVICHNGEVYNYVELRGPRRADHCANDLPHLKAASTAASGIGLAHPPISDRQNGRCESMF